MCVCVIKREKQKKRDRGKRNKEVKVKNKVRVCEREVDMVYCKPYNLKAGLHIDCNLNLKTYNII